MHFRLSAINEHECVLLAWMKSRHINLQCFTGCSNDLSIVSTGSGRNWLVTGESKEITFHIYKLCPNRSCPDFHGFKVNTCQHFVLDGSQLTSYTMHLMCGKIHCAYNHTYTYNSSIIHCGIPARHELETLIPFTSWRGRLTKCFRRTVEMHIRFHLFLL